MVSFDPLKFRDGWAECLKLQYICNFLKRMSFSMSVSSLTDNGSET